MELELEMELDKAVAVNVGSTRVDILGTAHISKVSQDSVRHILVENDYDVVAVELCQRRYQAILEPQSIANMNLLQVIKQGKAMTTAAMLAMGAYQQRLAEQLKIEVGAEIKQAVLSARQKECPVVLIDRDVGITLRRLYRATAWWKRMTLMSSLMLNFFTRQTIDAQQVEDIKRGDMFESMFKEMELSHSEVKTVLIDERDKYMAAKILQYIEKHQPQRIFVVVGMGHLRGICDLLEAGNMQSNKEIEKLDQMPSTSKIIKALPWVIVAIILAGFIAGFWHGTEIGMNLVYAWILINGGLASLGALIAGAHPLTLVTAFIAAPLTSINPTIGAGMVTAMAELLLRKPKVADFENLRKEVVSFRGWRRNNVARVLLIFVLSTIGSAIGTYVGGIHIYQQVF